MEIIMTWFIVAFIVAWLGVWYWHKQKKN